MEEREHNDEVELPEEAVEDLEPTDEEAEEAKGGAFKQGFPIKWEGAG